MSDDPELAPGDEAPEEEPSAAENICPECGGDGCDNCGGTGTVVEAVGGG
jgi:hypothetical protein